MADLTRVQQAVQSAASVPGVRNLNARQSGNQIEIVGEAENLAAKQNVMRAITEKVGDTSGIINHITIATEKKPEAASASNRNLSGFGSAGMTSSSSAGARTHTVQKGETLSHLAHKYYGKASEYKKIFDANRDQLSDPDKVREGAKLVIP